MLFSRQLKDEMAALSRAQAMIWFEPDGTVVSANDNFRSALGYSSQEIEGQHHRMFCDIQISESEDYKRFWDDLRAGRYQRGQFGLPPWGDPVGMLVHAWPAGHRWR